MTRDDVFFCQTRNTSKGNGPRRRSNEPRDENLKDICKIHTLVIAAKRGGFRTHPEPGGKGRLKFKGRSLGPRIKFGVLQDDSKM